MLHYLTVFLVTEKGPEEWLELNLTDPNQPNHFGKNKQSPIHIKTSEVEEASYRPLKITFDKTRGLVTGTLKNNWHLPKVEPADFYGASLTGGPLGDNTFELLQFHVHFGWTYDRGSEHKLDGTQLSGQVNVTAMLAFFLLHLTYRHFSFLISWPAGYLCLEKRFQWSIKDQSGRECIYVFDIQCWAILLAIEKYFTEVDMSDFTGRFAFRYWCAPHMHLLQVPICVSLWFAISYW